MATLTDPFEFEQNLPPNVTRRVGLAVPFGSNKSGGLLRFVGENNDTKTIVLALMSEESENAFQQPTDPIEASIFEVSDPASIAIIRRKLDLIFAEFEREHRFRLLPETLDTIDDGEGGLQFYFKYINLESDQIQELSLTVG